MPSSPGSTLPLRYDNLDNRAKKAIFKIFIERVRVLEKMDLMPFSEEDYNALARHDLNGRQIKNTVRTAQALAVNKREPLSMSHIKQVLEVQMSFDRDLKGRAWIPGRHAKLLLKGVVAWSRDMREPKAVNRCRSHKPQLQSQPPCECGCV